jgi:Skp family chaperone for outer membrane proteins
LGSEVDLLEKFVAKELSMLSRMAFGRGSLLVLCAALVLIAAGTPLGAQEVAFKVGVFNADRVLAESAPGQQALALFNQLRDQRVGELQVQQNEINGLQQQAATATPGTLEAARLERDLEDRLLRLDRLQQDVQQELGMRQNELTVEITELVSQIISSMGQEEGYAVIFNTLQSGLVYVSPALDLTDEIIGKINAMSAPDPA